MSEFRTALQALADAVSERHGFPEPEWISTKLAIAHHAAVALLARPEPEPVLTYDQFWERVRETGWNPSPEQLRAQLIAAEPEPRITRQEAMAEKDREIQRLKSEVIASQNVQPIRAMA